MPCSTARCWAVRPCAGTAGAGGQGLAAQAGGQRGGAQDGQQREARAHQFTVNVVSLPPTELSPTHRCNCPGSITNWPWSL